MPFLLKHFFDPDFDHLRLKPRDIDGERVDHFNLGYAQNVKKGSLIAQWESLDAVEAASMDGRFIRDEKRFPAGANCVVDPKDPDKLLAAVDGYVFYLDGKITVKSELNIRGGVDFRTGNINFVGDVVVHGPVRSGFSVMGRDVRLKNVVEAARVKAIGSIVADAGVKGGGSGWVEAGDKIKLAFCEGAGIRSGGNIVIRHSSLHCDIYCGGSLAVRGSLMGGAVHCRGLVLVEGVLGSARGAETQLVLGYDPTCLLESSRLDGKIREVFQLLSELETNKQSQSDDAQRRAEQYRAQIKALKSAKWRLWERVSELENLGSCRVAVPGEVRPGVEISIGEAFLRVDDPMRDVVFFRDGRDIAVASPALPRNK